MQTLESQAFSERLLQGADIRKKPWSFAKSFGACLDYIRTILKSPKKTDFGFLRDSGVMLRFLWLQWLRHLERDAQILLSTSCSCVGKHMRFLQNLNTYCRCGRLLFFLNEVHPHCQTLSRGHLCSCYSTAYLYLLVHIPISLRVGCIPITSQHLQLSHVNRYTPISIQKKKTQKPQYKRHIKPITIHTPQVWVSRRKTSLFWAPRQAGGFGLCFVFFLNGYLMAIWWLFYGDIIVFWLWNGWYLLAMCHIVLENHHFKKYVTLKDNFLICSIIKG